MAPTRVRMFFSAQRPKAAEPPEALTRATMMPSSTRNKKMPALPSMADTSPSLTMVSRVATGAKLHWNSAPTRMPMKREEYASLVIRARTMATMGGTRAQKVACRLETAAVSPSEAKAAAASARQVTTARMAARTLRVLGVDMCSSS